MSRQFLETFAGAISIKCGDIGNCSTRTQTISDAFGNIVEILIFLVGGLALIFVIISGLQMALSVGDAKRYQQGREALKYSIVGVALAIAAYAIVTYITGAFS